VTHSAPGTDRIADRMTCVEGDGKSHSFAPRVQTDQARGDYIKCPNCGAQYWKRPQGWVNSDYYLQPDVG
jgi:hypothetical protein